MSVSPGRLSPTLTFRNRTRPSPELSCSNGSSSETNTSIAATTGNCLLRRKINIYLFIFTISFSAFFLLSAYHVIPNPTRFERANLSIRTSQNSLDWNSDTKTRTLSRTFPKSLYLEKETPTSSASLSPYKNTRTGTVPIVYRTVLERLSNLDHEQAALVIPAAPSLPTSNPFLHVPSVKPSVADICSESPCRFLLPLRIAEQESKARIHLLEIIQAAKILDRVLVLPHVGKSRLGLCFRWSLEAYYDEDLLLKTLNDEGVRAVTLEAFKSWLESEPLPSPRGQLLSLGSKTDSDRPGSRKFIDDKDGLIISVDDEPVALEDSRFPGCFAERFGALLSSEFTPISISPSSALSKSLRKQPIGGEIIAALARDDIKNASRFPVLTESVASYDEPEVIMLDWSMRHPIFRQAFQGSITYSPWLEQLAKKVSPVSPYLMIHWRMESVSPDALPDCAHDLVDTISNLLHAPGLGDGIQKVWFAGDYPFPIVNHLYPLASDRAQITTTPKSGTFRNFGSKHTEAVDILVDAFRDGAELERWDITDLAAELVRMEEDDDLSQDVHPDFLSDSGALGILDKIIGMNAALFVGGAKGCGRTSSFTKQVIERRRDIDASPVRNVVEYFG